MHVCIIYLCKFAYTQMLPCSDAPMTLPIKIMCTHACTWVYMSAWKCVCVDFISCLIKLWRAESVGRPQTQYAVNRLLIEREIRGVEERTVEKRYEKEEEGGDERGIVNCQQSHSLTSCLTKRGRNPHHVTPVVAKLNLTGTLTFNSVKVSHLYKYFCHCTC